jgi:hypothetical protein
MEKIKKITIINDEDVKVDVNIRIISDKKENFSNLIPIRNNGKKIKI